MSIRLILIIILVIFLLGGFSGRFGGYGYGYGHGGIGVIGLILIILVRTTSHGKAVDLRPGRHRGMRRCYACARSARRRVSSSGSEQRGRDAARCRGCGLSRDWSLAACR